MKVTIELPHLTPDYVLGNAACGYWWNVKNVQDAAPEHSQYINAEDIADENDYAPMYVNKWPELTEDRLAAGVVLLVSRKSDERIIGRIMSGYADGNDLDVLLQLALFGEVVYG